MAVSVPKRIFKKAVDRNLLKRRIREAYRLNKPGLYELAMNRGVKIHMVIQYHEQDISDYSAIEKGLHKGLMKLAHNLEKQDRINK